MEKISLNDFAKQTHNFPPSTTFIFDTDNQTWSKVKHSLHYVLRFTTMQTTHGSIFFKSAAACLKLDRVKSVLVKEPSVLGQVFTVVCDESPQGLPDTVYTIIAQ